MPKWTKGPWRAEKPLSGFNPDGGWTISDEANGFGLCSRSPWPHRAAESTANAHLIAAAPTMADYIQKRATSGDAEAAAIWEAINADS